VAESSIFWTTGATGDGTTAYTQAEVTRWLRQTFVKTANEGILKGYQHELETTGTSSPVATNTGAAYLRGFPYWNTASVNTAIPTPSGNTRIDRIVLRASWSAQTIRITRIAGTEGSGTPPSLVQTDGTTWDVPLTQCSITTGGVITVTDEREYVHPSIAVNTAMLDTDAVTLPKMAANSVDDTKAGNRVPQFYRRQGGSATEWYTAGTTDYTPTAVRMQAGVVAVILSSESHEGVTVTFPVAFAYRPIVLATCRHHTTPGYIVEVTSVEVNTVTLEVYTGDERSVSDTVQVNWLAIGPE